MKFCKNRLLASSFLISHSLIPSLHAATGTWNGTATGTWNTTATNWSGVTGTPWDSTNGQNSTAIFNLASLAAPVSGTVYTNGITFNTSGAVAAGGTVNLAGSNPFLSAASGIGGSINSVLAGTAGFTKTGAGSITIGGSSAGSLSGQININAGQLVIQPGANVSLLSSTATLAMTGGSMSFLGASTAASPRSQTFAGTTISSGHSAISVNSNALPSVTDSLAKLTLGTVSRSSGATVNLAYTGQQTTVGRRTIQSSSWTAGTILDSGVAYATYAASTTSTATSPRSGNDWAASDASGNVILATYTNNTATALAGNADVSATGNTNTTLATGAAITSLRFSQAAARTVTLTSGNLSTGGILVSSGVGNFTQTITGGTLSSAATVANKDLVVIQNNTGNDLIIGSQIINATAGATGLTKSGTGRLTLTSSSNNYTGETRINEGILRIGSGGGTGALSTSSAIVNNATLQFDRSAAMTQGTHFSNIISGTGSLSVERTTTVTLNSANNTFSGGVSIPTDGVLKLTHGAALGTGTLTIGNGNGTADHAARLELTNNISVANAISLNGRVNSTSDGIRNVSGNNTLSGTITQFAGGGTGYIQSDSGLLTLGTNGSNAITVGSSVSSTRTVVLRGVGNGNVAGKIVDNTSVKNIAVTKDGTGTWTLSDANTYTGTTTVNQGTLTVASTGTLGATTGALVVGNNNTTSAGTDTLLNLSTTADTVKGSLSGAVLAPFSGTNTAIINTGGSARNFTVNQTAVGTFAGVIAGDGGFTLGSLSTNTLTLSGNNTYTGQTNIAAGTLALGLNGTISNTLVMGSSTPSVGTLDVTAKSAFTQANVSGNGILNIGVGKVISVTGALSPGFSPGTINVTGDLTIASSTTTTMELAGNGGTEGIDSDDINVSGTITLDGILSIVGFGGYDPTQNAAYNLFDAATFTGDFDSVSVGGDALSYAMDVWSGTYGLTTYSFSEATGVLTVVPEPGAALIGGLGMLALLRRRRSA